MRKKRAVPRKFRPGREKKRLPGFTLAELLIAVAVLAVLVSLALPVFTGALERARETVVMANARTIKSLAAAAVLGNGVEPDNGWYVCASVDREGNILDLTVEPMGRTEELLRDGMLVWEYDGVTYYMLHLKPQELAEGSP